jgi:hypothetical protein
MDRVAITYGKTYRKAMALSILKYDKFVVFTLDNTTKMSYLRLRACVK